MLESLEKIEAKPLPRGPWHQSKFVFASSK